MNACEAETLAALALGRLFRIGSRPFQKGDIEQYEKCRAVLLECAKVLRIDARRYQPNYARDCRP